MARTTPFEGMKTMVSLVRIRPKKYKEMTNKKLLKRCKAGDKKACFELDWRSTSWYKRERALGHSRAVGLGQRVRKGRPG